MHEFMAWMEMSTLGHVMRVDPRLLGLWRRIPLALMLTRSVAWRACGTRELSRGEDRQSAWMGGTSLACWLTAVGAGRMIRYW